MDGEEKMADSEGQMRKESGSTVVGDNKASVIEGGAISPSDNCDICDEKKDAVATRLQQINMVDVLLGKKEAKEEVVPDSAPVQQGDSGENPPPDSGDQTGDSSDYLTEKYDLLRRKFTRGRKRNRPPSRGSHSDDSLRRRREDKNEAEMEDADSNEGNAYPDLTSTDSSADEDDGDDDDDNDDDQSHDEVHGDSSDDDITVPPYPTTLPKHKWFAMKELHLRQLGSACQMQQSLFSERVTGSLSMVQRLKLISKLDCHEGCVNSLHFNKDGTMIASGSDDLNVAIWDWAKGRPILIFDSGHRSNVFQTKFMPYSGDRTLVTCARDGQVRTAELSSAGECRGTRRLASHKGAVHKLAINYDLPHEVLSCGEDAVVMHFDLRQDRPNKLLVTKVGDRKIPLYSICSHPIDSNEFITSGRDPFVRVYDKRMIRGEVSETKRYCPHHLMTMDVKPHVTSAVYSSNGSEILGSYNDEDIYLFETSMSTEAPHSHVYRGHRNNATVKGINFYGPQSEYVISGSDCGHIFIWDKETEAVVQCVEGDEAGVINVLEPHPYFPILATSGLDHDVKIWAPMSPEPTKLEALKKTMNGNYRNRQSTMEANFDTEMLWQFVRHFRRLARRQNQQETRDSDSESNESGESESDSDSEQHRIVCAPS